jgi:hypothetical protein
MGKSNPKRTPVLPFFSGGSEPEAPDPQVLGACDTRESAQLGAEAIETEDNGGADEGEHAPNQPSANASTKNLSANS